MADVKPRLTAAPPKRKDALMVDISRGGAAQAVIYGRGAVVLIRGNECFRLNDAEVRELEKGLARYRRSTEETDA